jgi:prophage maintenance system killer protein
MELHSDQLRLYGGTAGIRDLGALDSAVATPAATFDDAYPRVYASAARYEVELVSIACSRLNIRYKRVPVQLPLPRAC